ncbi:bud32 protein kinase [Teratosphaeria destructans]|uniref:EKC/KEOPS complex subunit BUD32 n=1 Tax=Teratosphaeria destructans TaxID=418781 RepID=A0A9W7SZ74_9PEZI|nr:bud32 protein kinase [Teratosphaeria destructans]
MATPEPPASIDPLTLLPPPFNTSPEPFHLIAQGAESLLFRTTFLTPTTPAALKVRPEKKWRHPILDKRLTRARILAEARVLVKLSGEGIAAGGGGRKVKGKSGDGKMRGCVPAVLGLDWERGWLVTEWVEGCMVKEGIYRFGSAGLAEEVLRGLLWRVGEVVGRLHSAGVVHGDLTTSNMMLRFSMTGGLDGEDVKEILEGDLVLIDFGLAIQSVQDEDRAVDLYVLERAFGSTHPKEEHLFPVVLEGYAQAMGKAGKVVLRRLEDVRMRGRKKSMIG